MIDRQPYDMSDDSWIKRGYIQFTLDNIDEQNLKEIEKNLDEGLIDSSNKEIILGYLHPLFIRIIEVKKAEYEYEGDANLNVNRYLERIKALIDRVSQIKSP